MSRQTAAKATSYYGITFPSGLEARRFLILNDMVDRGVLDVLKVAARGEVAHFVLIPEWRTPDGRLLKAITYTPDFVYRYRGAVPDEHGRIWHVEEAKGRKFRDYPLRAKLFQRFYPQYFFHEVFE